MPLQIKIIQTHNFRDPRRKMFASAMKMKIKHILKAKPNKITYNPELYLSP